MRRRHSKITIFLYRTNIYDIEILDRRKEGAGESYNKEMINNNNLTTKNN